MSVYFDNRQEKIQITKEFLDILEKVVDVALKKEGINFSVEISISFVDNEEIQQLNNVYRDNNTSTDVLSFPLIEKEKLDKRINQKTEMLLGDIVISIPKTIEQSEEYGHSFLRELAYLTVHGIYHLLGYDHIDLEDKKIMREKEELVMEELQIFRTFS
jgi:probable rRNA maturation factor